jgi:NAD(P)-dependent dehydrogenase (short-subunit alcohol dehydrogenase family)
MGTALRVAAGALGVLAGARWLAPRASLRGAVVSITGGSRGLGLLIGRELARKGAKLSLCARDAEELERAKADLEKRGAEVLTVVCDVANRGEAQRFVDETVRRFGVLDVLVNCASIIQVAPQASLSLEDFHDAMNVNFWGSVHVTLAALPHLRMSSLKRIVNIASIGAEIAVPHLLPYDCAKFAVRGFSEGLAAELAREGIRVSTIVPGLMRTGSFLQALVKGKRAEEVQWFTVGASMPIVSIDAGRAARRIVLACERGERFVVVGWPAKAARMAHAVAPGLTIRALALVNRLLPNPGGAGPSERAEPGREHREGIARTKVVALGDRAARENNEVPGAMPEPT